MTKDFLGSIAALLTTAAFLPQVVMVWRTRQVRDISLPMYAIFVSGVAVWILYGVAILAWPVILANVATLLLSASVLVAKIRFGPRIGARRS